MHVGESIKMAVATLGANKLRSALTMLGIIIGNAAVVAMVGIGQGAQNFAIEKLESFGANRLFVFTESEDSVSTETYQLTLEDAEAIATVAPAVKAVAPQVQAKFSISYQSKNTKADVVGTTPGASVIGNLYVGSGRFFDRSQQQQNAQVVVLGSDLARKLFERSNPLGSDVQINNLSFQIVGVLQPKGSFAGEKPDETVYIPISTMVERVTGRKASYGTPIDWMQLSAKNKQSVRAAAFQVENILTRRRGKKDFEIEADQSFNNLITQVTGTLSLMLAAIAAISLIVGGIGIMNIMLVSVTERTSEIGLRKALGATQKDILSQFLIEAVILSSLGGLLGIGFGIGSGIVVGNFTPLKPTIPIRAIALAISVSGGIGLIFGVVPAQQAAKLDPIAALRNA